MRNQSLLFFSFILICSGLLYSQTDGKGQKADKVGSSYEIPWDVIASGGCVGASSGSYGLSASIGQVFSDSAGSVNYSVYSGFINPSIIGAITTVEGQKEELLPKHYQLNQNYPNPFNPMTTIDYALPEPSDIVIEIYDITGRRVTVLRHENQKAGYHSIQWNGINHLGNKVGSGIYCYCLRARSLQTEKRFIRTMKMLLVK